MSRISAPFEYSSLGEYGASWRTFLIGLSMLVTVAIVSVQNGIAFDDGPEMSDFTDAEISARGQQKFPELTYSKWEKLCFSGVEGMQTKMVCRTTISGKSDIGQVTLKLDLIERLGAPAARLLIFVPTGLLLRQGIKLTVDNGVTMQVPYISCLANGCAAATIADRDFVRAMESGRMLSLEVVNSNIVSVIASLPLGNFADAHQGVAVGQKLE